MRSPSRSSSDIEAFVVQTAASTTSDGDKLTPPNAVLSFAGAERSGTCPGCGRSDSRSTYRWGQAQLQHHGITLVINERCLVGRAAPYQKGAPEHPDLQGCSLNGGAERCGRLDYRGLWLGEELRSLRRSPT